MAVIDNIIRNLPEVTPPTQKRLAFKEKLKWTAVVLGLFFVMGMIPLWGGSDQLLSQFEYLSIILGASFGSIITLGIGPIVTASIVLQLLNGSGIVKFDLTSPEGKRRFQGIQKILAIFFIVFESAIYVLMGGLAPTESFAGMKFILIFQLVLGGLIILFLDEVVSKWGIGSGVSLFIAAGVSKEVFVQMFWFLGSDAVAQGYVAGRVPQFFQALAQGDPTTAGIAFTAIAATVVVFVVAVYMQAMKIEIPLSFGRVRGHAIRWPLNFVYANVLPVILISALLANMQLLASLFQRLAQNSGFWSAVSNFFGTISPGGGATSGLIAWLSPPGGGRGLLADIVTQGFDLGWEPYLRSIVYILVFMVGCIVFSYFWVQTSGMDAQSVAKQIMGSGLQIPGFRRDQRVLEHLLARYIGPLTIMGGAAIGFISAIADILGAIGTGTGLMLAVMIIYKFYEEIAQQHMMDMHPALRKMME